MWAGRARRISTAISEQARRNHDELFPGHTSTLAVTDPELIETFDNFVFDEVLRHGSRGVRLLLFEDLVEGAAVCEVFGLRVSPSSATLLNGERINFWKFGRMLLRHALQLRPIIILCG